MNKTAQQPVNSPAQAESVPGGPTESSSEGSRFIVKVNERTSPADLEKNLAQGFGLADAQELASSGVSVEELFPGSGARPDTAEFAKFFVLSFAKPIGLLAGSDSDVTSALQSKFGFAHIRGGHFLIPHTPKTMPIPIPPDPSPGDGPGPGPQPNVAFDCAWSLRYMNVINGGPWQKKPTSSGEPTCAWDLKPLEGGASKGEGILIGHPDTGWHRHWDVNDGDGGEINTALSWNTLDFFWPWQSRHEATDPLQPEPFTTIFEPGPFGLDLAEINRGHGTTGASVAVSRGRPTDYVQGTFGGTERDSYGFRIAGVAPAAQMVPIRCTNQVLILETVNPAFERALYYAICDANVHIISCSLGVPPLLEPWLNPASPSVILLVNEAKRRNIIFVAAVGQEDLGYIPMPASLPDVIAVSGCDSNGRHVGNAGRKVAIAAPAMNLYEAFFSFPDPAPAEPIREVLGNPATSFATTEFAGIVALWLAYWGRQNLLNKYPNTPLTDVLSKLLPECVNTPDGWNTATQGPGIIDAYKLLTHALPDPAEVSPPLRHLTVRAEPSAITLGSAIRITVFAEDSITHAPVKDAEVTVETSLRAGGRRVTVQFPANALSPPITFNTYLVHGPHGDPGDELEPSGRVSATGYADADIPFSFTDDGVERPASSALKSHLLAFYPFEGNANDTSGNGRDGTVFGAALTTGFEGSAYSFNGTSDYILAPLNVSPSIHPQLTMGAWVNAASSQPIRQIISQDNGGFKRSVGIDSRGGGTGWSTFAGSNEVLGFQPVTNDRWVFVAVVYDQAAGKVTLYVENNVVRGSRTIGDGWDFIRIGSNPSFGEFFHGKISNVFILDQALNAEEIASIRQYGPSAFKTPKLTSRSPSQLTP